MSTVGEFFTALGLTTLIILLTLGVCYWIRFAFKKIAPNFTHWVKYKVFRKKHNQEEIERLSECLDRGMNNDAVRKFFLIGGVKPKKVEELIYIYQEMRKLKGGVKNE